MNFIKAGFFMLLVMMISCKDESEVCDNAVFPLSDLASDLKADPKYSDDYTYDTEVHEYTFSLAKSGTLCSIGYQSHPDIDEYKIELIDAGGNILLQENLSFSSTSLQYVPVNAVQLSQGVFYTLRRTALDYNFITDAIGSILREENSPFGVDTLTLPVSNNLMTITAVQFYGNGGPLNNAIPIIDFGFVED